MSNAPFGKNLESACKAYAYQQSMKPVNVECGYCGGKVEQVVRQKDANRKHFCGPACEMSHIEDGR